MKTQNKPTIRFFARTFVQCLRDPELKPEPQKTQNRKENTE